MATASNFPTSPVSQNSEIQNSPAGHSRNLSAVSSNTLHTVTNTTLHSTPYEALLPPISQSSSDDYEVASRHSRPSPILSLARWSQSNMPPKHSSPKNEKISSKESSSLLRNAKAKAKRLKSGKRVLEIILVIWSIYSTGRYLFAFTIYQGVTGQLATLLLGICTGLSFAFTACSFILSLAQKHLLVRGFSVHALLAIRSALQYLSSLCFLGPSIVNLVLLVAWRNSFDHEIQFYHRCKLDLDLVWTITYSLCDNISNSWGTWVALAVIRIILSIVIIIAFHIISNSQVIFIPKPHHVNGLKSHKRLHSDYPSKKDSSSKKSGAASRSDPALLHLTTERSLSNKSSPRHRLRSAQSHSSEDPISRNHQDFLSMGSQTDPTFIERFRSMISQITRETDEGLAYARASYTSCQSADSPTSLDMDVETLHNSHYDPYEDEDDFYVSVSPRHETHPDGNQQQNHHPVEDQHVRVMNGYIKRMPTIESMGSHELLGSLGSAGASSLNTNHDRNGFPPTRNTVVSWNGTDLSGSGDVRRRSLTAQAELLVGMSEKNHLSEIGELMILGETTKLVDSGTSGNTYHSSTSESKASAQTFHTAPNGDYASDSLTSALADATNTSLPIQNSSKDSDS